MPRATSSFDLERLARRLSVAALAVVAALLAAAALRKVWGADYWWQWALGRYVIEHGIPRTDVFSYTAYGDPWIELRWLYGLALYKLTDAFGVGAAVVAKTLLLASTFALVTAAGLRRNLSSTAGLVLAVAILAASQRFYVRPELVTFLLFAVYVFLLSRFRDRGTATIFLIPLLQVVWTNAHTLFILGPLLAGLLLVVLLGRHLLARRAPSGDRPADLRPLLLSTLVLLLTIAACFVNPYGWRGVAFPFQLFGEIQTGAFKEAISEFRSPFSFEQSYTSLDYYKLLIVICIGSALINWRRLDPFWTICVVSQFYLSALAIRNIPLFCLASIPFVIDNVRRSPLRQRAIDAGRLPAVRVLLSSIVIAGGCWFVWSFSTDRFNVKQNDTNQFGVGLAGHRYPERAVAFIESRGIEGRIFHTMTEGAYLLAHRHPVYIDPRLEVYGEEKFTEYMSTMADAAVWERTLDRHDARVVLVDIGSRIINHALASERWELVYFDEVAVVFVRADSIGPLRPIRPGAELDAALAGVRGALPALDEHPAPGWFERVVSPIPYQRVADLLLVLGQPRPALDFLRDAERVAPDPALIRQRQISAHRMLGDVDGVRSVLQKMIDADPTNAQLRETQRRLSNR